MFRKFFFVLLSVLLLGLSGYAQTDEKAYQKQRSKIERAERKAKKAERKVKRENRKVRKAEKEIRKQKRQEQRDLRKEEKLKEQAAKAVPSTN